MNLSKSRPLLTTILSAVALIGGAAVFFRGSVEDRFMPHAHCYLFNQKLMLLHGGSDLLIGLAYVSISATLTYLVFRARKDLPFHWMMLAFALFIVACGGTHFMEVWTLRAENPCYWMSGWVKLVTAIASVGTAMLLPPLVPKVLSILRSAQAAEQRRLEQEEAYEELRELYKMATQPVPRKEPLLQAEPGAGDLATMAREVTVHARQLERAKDDAVSANLAKDHFLAVLSHELRTPLTPALAAASGLESAEHIGEGELREALGIIRRNIELEARLVDDLLDLTRISRGKLEVHLSTIDLHETIRHAANMCSKSAQEKGTQLTLELKAPVHFAHGDAARLAQVFWNLLLNAMKFTPAEGRITVSTSNPAPNRFRVEVADTGIGIAPEMLARIFEPFQQGEEADARRYGGLGLGLSVAKGLVAAHGGTIVAHSAGRNCGATFVIELATAVPPATPEAANGASREPRQQPRLRILLVEDHGDTRRVLERLLTRWGHEVRCASTVAHAIEAAEDFDADLLLSDIGLPDGTGIDLLGKLRSRRDIKAIAMSGYGMETDLTETRHAGFAEHLIKPVSAERLKEMLSQVTGV
jgi:signal transduction histidine kinase